jgi:hypothetical protein
MLSSVTSSATDDPTDGLRSLDSWSVDWTHDGATFRHRAHAARSRTGARKLPTALTYAYADPGRYTIAAHVVDFAAHETTQMVEIAIE